MQRGDPESKNDSKSPISDGWRREIREKVELLSLKKLEPTTIGDNMPRILIRMLGLFIYLLYFTI